MKIPSDRKNITIRAIVIGLLLLVYGINFIFVINGLDTLQDFGSFVASGQLANEGKNPYSSDSPLVFIVDFSEIGMEGDAPNLNPPISVLLFQYIASLNPITAIKFWRITSILLFLASLFILHMTYPMTGFQAYMRFAWAISLAGFWHTIQLGQIYCLILFLAVLTYFFQKNNRFILAGICLGVLIAIKPNFVFLGSFALCDRQLEIIYLCWYFCIKYQHNSVIYTWN